MSELPSVLCELVSPAEGRAVLGFNPDYGGPFPVHREHPLEVDESTLDRLLSLYGQLAAHRRPQPDAGQVSCDPRYVFGKCSECCSQTLLARIHPGPNCELG